VEVQNGFIYLQTSQLGRLKRIPSSINKSYLTIKNLISKYESDDLLASVFAPNSLISLEIFGLLPHNIDKIYHDDANIGILDAMWLGLVPKTIDERIHIFLHKMKLKPLYLSNRKELIHELDDIWKCIKGLVLGKASGLHKIIGSISKAKDIELKKIYELDSGTRRELKRKTRSPENQITESKIDSKNKGCVKCDSGTKLESKNSPIILDTCTGISCIRTINKWQMFKHFKPNKIKHNTKHCTRCSKFCTIMRLARETINNIITNHDTKEHKKIISFISKSTLNNLSYPPFMNMLNKFLPKRQLKDKAKYTNRSKISDQHKNLCKVFIQSYNIVEAINREATEVLLAILDTINERLIGNNEKLDDAKKKNKARDAVVKNILFDCETVHQEQSKAISPEKIQHSIDGKNQIKKQLEIQIPDTPPDQASSIKETNAGVTGTMNIIEILDAPAENERDQRQFYINEALNDAGGLLSSMGAMRAIEVFRNEANTNHYFASTEASAILNNWSPVQGWERAARMFGSRLVMTTKPDGYYFIPIFDEGHWTLAVIQKIGRFKRGFIVDSLGASSTIRPINRKLEDLFRVHGGRFDWHSCESIRQQENECGLRMVVAILRTRKALREGLSLEEGIRRATLREEYNSERIYDSMKIRIEAARIIGSYNCTMWTGPVRLRNSSNEGGRQAEKGTGRKRKRRRKRK